jgi:hypothetical protein
MIQLKLLEKLEQAKLKISRWKEKIKIRAETSEMETKRTIQWNKKLIF